MIGYLSTSLEIDNKEYEINSDYRIALLIFEAYNDPDLSDLEKAMVCLQCLFKEVPPNTEEALKKAMWFLDGGDMPKSKQAPKKIMDWEQDQAIIFPAINKVAGYEVRNPDVYLHWWSFLGMFGEIGEGLYSQVMSIRSKMAKGKRLDKTDKEFYNEHKELIDIKVKLTPEEQAELDFINNLV